MLSVDQIVSQTPDLVAQMTGFLTKDHVSSLGYIHLQKSTYVKDTLEVKLAFDRYAH